jgi:hypothetical protein
VTLSTLVSHNRAVLSTLAVARVCPSELKATLWTPLSGARVLGSRFRVLGDGLEQQAHHCKRADEPRAAGQLPTPSLNSCVGILRPDGEPPPVPDMLAVVVPIGLPAPMGSGPLPSPSPSGAE